MGIESCYTKRQPLCVEGEKKEVKDIERHDTSLLLNDYEIVEGKRKGTKIYKKDDFGYLLANEGNSEKFYLKCVERNRLNLSSDCQARAILSDNKLELTKEHNHPPSKMYFQINALEHRMKRRAEEGKESLRKIFDEESLLDSDTAAHISFKSICSSMEKRRRNTITHSISKF